MLLSALFVSQGYNAISFSFAEKPKRHALIFSSAVDTSNRFHLVYDGMSVTFFFGQCYAICAISHFIVGMQNYRTPRRDDFACLVA